MKREDFKSITDKHFDACELIIRNDGACFDMCRGTPCPFSSENATNGYGCGKNKYCTPNIGTSYTDYTLINSAKEFLKFREEKDMRDIFTYNGKIYKVVYENEGSMLSAPISWYDYVCNAISVCKQEESGFFIRRDMADGKYYSMQYTQEYNTTEKILCLNAGYKLEELIAVLNFYNPDFKDFMEVINEL